MFKNLIGGEWVDGARASRNINPSDTRRRRRRIRAGRRRADARRRSPPRAARFPAWSLSTPQQRFDILDAAGSEILARRAELGDLLAREEGKTLPEAIGEVAARRQHLQVLRRRGAAARRRGDAVGAAGRRRGDHARADRRRRHHHAVELPDRDPRVEDRAGAGLRQLRGHQAGRAGAGLGLGAGRDPRRAAACRRACSTS